MFYKVLGVLKNNVLYKNQFIYYIKSDMVFLTAAHFNLLYLLKASPI